MDKNKDSDADGKFDKAPYFNFNDDKVKFDTNRVDNTNDNYGSASGFLPKSLLSEKGTLTKTGASFLIFGRFDPATKHSTDFIDILLKASIDF